MEWKLITEGLEYNKRVLLKDGQTGLVRIGWLSYKMEDESGIQYGYRIEQYTTQMPIPVLFGQENSVPQFVPTLWQELPE